MKTKINNLHNSVSKSFESLGTLNEIKIYNCDDSSLLDIVKKRVLEIDDTMSVFKPFSDISRLNKNAGKQETEISPETIRLLKVAKSFIKESEGAFDITVGPLVNLWGIGKKVEKIPSLRNIQRVKRLVNNKDIEINEKNNTAYLKHPGQSVDLGGIAKGYAVEEVKKILVENEVKSALINLGGSITLIGKHPDNGEWKIGIQNPLSSTKNYFGVLSLENKTVVTSGSNERFFIKNGMRYHHILDPRTGMPSQSGLLSVSVICENSEIADMLSTSVFVLGLEKGLRLLKSSNADAIFVDEENKIYVTDGIRKSFSIRFSEFQKGDKYENR